MAKSIETNNVHKLNLNEISSNLQNRSGLSFRLKYRFSHFSTFAFFYLRRNLHKKKKRSHFRGRFFFPMKFILYKINSIIFRIQSTYFSSKTNDRTQIQYFLIMYIDQLVHQIENNHILSDLR